MNNAGLFKKSGGTSTSLVQLPFNNSGTVNIQTGTLSLPPFSILTADAADRREVSAANTDARVTSLRILPSFNWIARSQGDFDYKDSSGSQDGIQKAQVRLGVAGKSKVQIGAKGLNIPLPEPFSSQEFFDSQMHIIVQLHNSSTAACWTSEFAIPKKNLPKQYQVKF